jgi:TonB-dependent receptor
MAIQHKKTIIMILVSVFVAISGLHETAIAQVKTGEIYGTILSEKSGERLYGINVVILNTKLGASTDIEGKFSIKKIPYGVYKIKISGIGFQTKIIEEYSIQQSKTEAVYTISEQAYSFNEVQVTSARIRSTEASVLTERKKISEISDYISAEQIKRAPDATAGDALKRVTGLTLVDNKFLFIRGISDRYNETTLDGSSVTSTEQGKKSFSFDLIPSNLIENTSVIKSASPDLPGDFSGGLVQMRTMNFPGENTIKINVSSSYNSLATGNSLNRSSGGSSNWLGFDNGSRSLPSFSYDNELAKKLPNNWSPKNVKAPTNSSFSVSSGNLMTFSEESEKPQQLGTIIVLTYQNSFQKNETTRNDYLNSRFYKGSKDNYNVLWGGIANISYKFLGTQIISFKNTYTQSAVDQISVGRAEESQGLHDKIYELNWMQRSNYIGQLSGEHAIQLGSDATSDMMKVLWRVSVSSSKKEEPDKKKAFYQADLSEDTSAPYYISTSQRSWDKMNERVFSYGLEDEIPLHVLSGKFDGKIKFGGSFDDKKTSYRIRYFNVAFNGFDGRLQTLPIDSIYMPQNFMQGKFDRTKHLFYYEESDKPTDSYRGDMQLLTSYFMADFPFTVVQQNFRLSGGARLENALQNIDVPLTNDPNGSYTKIQKKNIDILPSVNLLYQVHEKVNVRFAYYHTVNRPDFRELSPTLSYDYVLNETFSGNPDLQRAYIKNTDIRLEAFPEIGEVAAVSYFIKTFSGAIEERLQQSSTPLRLYFNSSYAENHGWEIELKKSLRFLGDYFSNFVVSANYTTVQSRVRVKTTTGNSISTKDSIYYRPLQGQSPYCINTSFNYNEPSVGLSVSVLYNKFGRRLHTVGFQASDIYEEPVDMVDMTINLAITSYLEMKLAVKNIGDKKNVLSRDNRAYEITGVGRTISLAFGYKY